ncbi:XdhC family protein [Gordonia sp. NPDC003376]
MRDVLPALIDRLAYGPVALARVITTTGASPRGVGASMLVTASGEVIGSVSGGCVESAVVCTAEQVLADGVAVIEHFGIAEPDGIGIGLTCGGELEVFTERVTDRQLPELTELAEALDAGIPIAWTTTLGESPRWQLTSTRTPSSSPGLGHDIDDLLRNGRSGIVGMDDCETAEADSMLRPRTFVHTFAPGSRLILVGANDFVRALGSLGTTVGYRVTVVDARPVFATRARFPDVDEVIMMWPDRYLAQEISAGRVDHRTCVCVMTHDAKFDVPTLQVALASPDIAFIGALGSRRTVADRRERLRENGTDPDQLGRIRSPLGLDLGAHAPAEVAVSIAAQLIAERHGRTATPLHQTSGPIHR